jgi:hypothetical protein
MILSIWRPGRPQISLTVQIVSIKRGRIGLKDSTGRRVVIRLLSPEFDLQQLLANASNDNAPPQVEVIQSVQKEPWIHRGYLRRLGSEVLDLLVV